MGRQGKEGQRTCNFVGWLANRDTVCMCIVHEFFPLQHLYRECETRCWVTAQWFVLFETLRMAAGVEEV